MAGQGRKVMTPTGTIISMTILALQHIVDAPEEDFSFYDEVRSTPHFIYYGRGLDVLPFSPCCSCSYLLPTTLNNFCKLRIWCPMEINMSVYLTIAFPRHKKSSSASASLVGLINFKSHKQFEAHELNIRQKHKVSNSIFIFFLFKIKVKYSF